MIGIADTPDMTRPGQGYGPLAWIHILRSSPVRTMSVDVRRTAVAYEAYIDGERVGTLTYSRHRGVVTAMHTEVSPNAKGKGVGSTLARALLDEARQAGRTVDAQCPFVAGWIDRHQEYADLLTG